MDAFQDTEFPDVSHLIVDSPLSAYPSSQEKDTTELNVYVFPLFAPLDGFPGSPHDSTENANIACIIYLFHLHEIFYLILDSTFSYYILTCKKKHNICTTLNLCVKKLCNWYKT